MTADEVDGGDPTLRRFLEDRGLSYVLAVKGVEPLRRAHGSAPATAEQLAARVPAEQWVACSAGHGAKGRRLYDWVRVELAAPAAAGWARGCWSVAAAPTVSWPSPLASPRPTPRWSGWSGSLGSAG